MMCWSWRVRKSGFGNCQQILLRTLVIHRSFHQCLHLEDAFFVARDDLLPLVGLGHTRTRKLLSSIVQLALQEFRVHLSRVARLNRRVHLLLSGLDAFFCSLQACPLLHQPLVGDPACVMITGLGSSCCCRLHGGFRVDDLLRRPHRLLGKLPCHLHGICGFGSSFVLGSSQPRGLLGRGQRLGRTLGFGRRGVLLYIFLLIILGRGDVLPVPTSGQTPSLINKRI